MTSVEMGVKRVKIYHRFSHQLCVCIYLFHVLFEKGFFFLLVDSAVQAVLCAFRIDELDVSERKVSNLNANKMSRLKEPP